MFSIQILIGEKIAQLDSFVRFVIAAVMVVMIGSCKICLKTQLKNTSTLLVRTFSCSLRYQLSSRGFDLWLFTHSSVVLTCTEKCSKK